MALFDLRGDVGGAHDIREEDGTEDAPTTTPRIGESMDFGKLRPPLTVVSP